MTNHWSEKAGMLFESALKERVQAQVLEKGGACRLFNGFTEGLPEITVDLYAQTLVLFLRRLSGEDARELEDFACSWYLQQLPELTCVVSKQRQNDQPTLQRGRVIYGSKPDTRIIENGVQYAIDLQMNQDASFYMDTRELRKWIKEQSRDRDVLNTFAYTGSLGVAALAGGAASVMQVDRIAKFLYLARQSVALNQLDREKMKLLPLDFFESVGRFKKGGQTFDIVILDPPFFSVTEKGRVDLAVDCIRLINKARPLVRDGGRLVVINNALYLSGRDFYTSLHQLEEGGYVTVEKLILVPEFVTGYAATCVSAPPVDPAPFNHSTKIAVLAVRKKAAQSLSII